MARLVATLLFVVLGLAVTSAPAAASAGHGENPRRPAGISLGCISNPPCVLTVVPGTVGDVYSSPVGITSCDAGGGDCSEGYAFGTQVVLQIYHIGYAHDFSGCDNGTETGLGADLRWRCTVTMTKNKAVTVTSSELSFTVNVVKGGNGEGTVAEPFLDLFNCGPDCTETRGQQLSVFALRATPAADSTFGGWSGCNSVEPDGSCRFDFLRSDRTINATFNLITYLLTVMKKGTGAGTVTSSPAGILCGNDCSQTYDIGEMVTLTAAAAQGSTFVGMSGGGCSGAQVTCTVTMDAATTVTATFDLTGSGGGAGGSGGGGGGGGGGGDTGDTAVDADLLGVKATKTLLGKRVLKVELEAGEKIEVVLELLRNGKVIARKRIASFRAGHRVVNWVLGRRLGGGRARLEIELADAAENELDFTRRVRIAPPP